MLFAPAPLFLATTLVLSQDAPTETLFVRAGQIHTVDEAGVLEDAAMIVRDGKIVAVGTDLTVPIGAIEIDYGSSAVLVPGFVAADSRLAEGLPSARTASPDLSALDGFDFFSSNASSLASGVTSAYVTPARGRLIAGQGAVVKLAGEDRDSRILKESAAVHSAISSEARNTPGYWEPPVPATVDVGLGLAEPQLPRTTMGALVALGELLAGVANEVAVPAYGPRATDDLGELVEAGVPWRITAVERQEIAAALAFAKVRELDLVISGAHFADSLADRLAEAEVPVIYEIPFRPNRNGVNFGSADSERASLETPSNLDEAGVSVALTPAAGSSLRDLRFAALMAIAGGLDAEKALAGITRVPAEIYGVADRVGSLAPGKDADFVVFGGSPLEPSASLVATYVDGEAVWKPEDAFRGEGDQKADTGWVPVGQRKSTGPDALALRTPANSVVLSVEELHVGDGETLTPGEVLIVDGRIAEVGRRVGRPSGAPVVRGFAAMPGMIDTLGNLGLEGSRRVPAVDFDLTRIVEPGDRVDREVARAGVTTVALNPQGNSSDGAPIMAYRPAASDDAGLVVDPLAALRTDWRSGDRSQSGNQVRSLLDSAVEYEGKWAKYESELSKWKDEKDDEEAPRPEFRLPGDEDDEDEEEEEGDEDADDKKKKKKSKEIDPDPVTGIWISEGEAPKGGLPAARMQIRLNEDGTVEGFLRSPLLSARLLDVTGTFGEEGALTIEVYADRGQVVIEGELDELVVDAEEVRFEAKTTLDGTEIEFELLRNSREYPVARRTSRFVAPEDDEDEDDKKTRASKSTKGGPPKAPKTQGKLEPFRRAMRGEAAILVQVQRADEILECVDAFEEAGIKPVLLEADQAHLVADQLQGRVSGVLLSTRITESEGGIAIRNRYASLQGAGIPVAFRSNAAEGAVDLPRIATYAVVEGMSPAGAMRALTSDAAKILAIEDEVGRLKAGLSGDVLLLNGSPMLPATHVQRVWVAGREIR